MKNTYSHVSLMLPLGLYKLVVMVVTTSCWVWMSGDWLAPASPWVFFKYEVMAALIQGAAWAT